jgi:hypothetical protein
VTPAERAFWQRAQRQANQLSPELRAALLRAFEIIRESVPAAQLERIIAAGSLEALMRVALNEAVLDIAFRDVRTRIRTGVEANVKYFARDLPKGGKVNGRIAIAFDVLNPNTVEGIRQLDTKVIQTLKDDAREVVRAIVENGLRDGAGARAIARDLRASIGLAPTQAAAVARYREGLENGDRGLHRALRDRRFDRSELTPAKIDTMVDAYRRRFVAFNAETNARTASIDAMKLGHRLSWEDAGAKGIVKLELLQKTWRGVMDSRERESHRAMEGKTVPFDQPFGNGQMIPGETEFNCRCVAIYRERRP